MSKSTKGNRDESEPMFSQAELDALTKDGLTVPLADALETIASALRANVASGAVATPTRRTKPMTIQSRTPGLHLTLVINARREDADEKE